MFRIHDRVAQGFCDLMTASLRIVTILGVIIPFMCPWTSCAALALSTKPMSLDSRFNFKLRPEDSTVLLPDQFALFKCSELHTPNAAVQWLKDNIPIGSDTSSVQRINKRRRNKSRKRSIPWRSRHRSHHARSLNTSASDLGKISNTSNTFSTKFSVGDAGFTVLRNGSLQIGHVKGSHAGEYKCFVKDSYSKILRSKFSLTIAGPPQCTILHSMGSVYEYGAARFFCFKDSAIDVVYSWSKDGQFLPKNEKFVQLSNGALQIFNLSLEDSGQYRCHVKSVLGNATCVGTPLNILPQTTYLRPKFTFLAKPLNVEAYPPYKNGAIFECLVDDPNVTYSWKRTGGKKICPPNKACPLTLSSQYNNLVLSSNIGKYYNGEYVCIIRDRSTKAKAEIEKSAWLDLYVEPTLTFRPPPDEVRLSKSTTLTCTATGKPSPSVYWLKDGVVVKEDESWSGQVKIWSQQITEEKMSFLTLSGVESTMAGYYQCVAENRAGGASAWINLTVTRYEIVPCPENVTAIAQSGEEILVKWNASDHLGIISYRVMYDAQTSPGGAVIVNSTTTSVVLTGLRTFTEYVIKVVAFTSLDPSDPSEVVQVRTMEGIPCDVVKTEHLKAQTVNSTTILVSWQSLPIKGRCGVITEYEVKFMDEWMEEHMVKVPTRRLPLDDNDDVPVMEYALISGLRPGQEYPVSVTPATRVGTGSESEFAAVQLLQPETNGCLKTNESAFEHLSGHYDGKSRDLRVEWELKPGLSMRNISTFLVSSDRSFSRTKLLDLIARNVTFQFVDPLKAYLVTVSLFSSDDQPCESRTIAVLSEIDAEDAAPFGITGTPSARGCIDLSWSCDQEICNKTQLFVVRYNLVRSVAHKNAYEYINSTKMSASVCGLRPWSDYEFAVAYAAGLEMPYNSMKFAEMERLVRTPEQEPGVPSNLRCVISGLGQVKCKWDEPWHPNGRTQSYALKYRKRMSAMWHTVTSVATFAIVRCIEPEKIYYFKVYATNSAGDGEASTDAPVSVGDYNTSLVNCTFGEKPEPPVESYLLKYLAIGAGIFGLFVMMSIALLCFFSHRRPYRSKGYWFRKEVKVRASQNGTKKNERSMNGSSASHNKQNGYHVQNGLHPAKQELLEEQRATLLHNGGHPEPQGNGHIVGGGLKNGCKTRDVLERNGYRKGSPPVSKSNGTVDTMYGGLEEETRTAKIPFSLNTLLRSKAYGSKSMAVPESNDEMVNRNWQILSVPIPKHTGLLCNSSSVTGSRDEHCSTSFDSRNEDP